MKKRDYLIFSIITIILMLVILRTTSPLIGTVGGDSAIFLTIGKSIASGNIVYVDIFDHKGPILFFLNAIPQIFIKGMTGVWVLQVLFCIATVLIILKISDMVLENKFAKYSIPCIYFYYIATTFEGGNLSEEYSNLFCVIALYIFVKYLKEGFAFKNKYPLILGSCFMANILIRINNTALIVSVLLTVFLIMINKKEFKNLINSIWLFIVGNLIVFLPIALYFIINNAFYDFIYGTFLYNMKYKDGGIIENILKFPTFERIYIKMFLIFIGLSLIDIILLWIKKEKENCIFVIINFIVTFVAISAGGKDFLHYLTIASLGIVYNLILLFKFLELSKYRVAIIILSAFIIGITAKEEYKQFKEINYHKSYISTYRKEVEELSKNINKGEKVFGYNTQARWFYIADIIPDAKYFTLQDWWSSFDPTIYGNLNEYIDNNSPTWIITPNLKSVGNSHVKSIIENNYVHIQENSSGALYKIKGAK